MQFDKRNLPIACLAVIAGVSFYGPSGLAQQAATGTPAAAAKGKAAQPPDPRVEQRNYHFADTNVDLPYAVFVSSKVTKDKKSPLIIALHGLGGNPNTLMRRDLLDLAGADGYIVFAP